MGLPAGHPLHPGPAWVAESLLGDAIDLGVGILGLDPHQPDVVVVVPATAWAGARTRPAPALAAVQAVARGDGSARRTALGAVDRGRLLPMGDCDVLTLLGSASLRTVSLAGSDGGMRAVVVPMRRRGWTRLSRLDPAFAPAAAMATDPDERGVLRPLLVTAEGGRARR